MSTAAHTAMPPYQGFPFRRLMKDMGYGKGYKYAHDFDEGIVAQENRPANVADHRYYEPTDRGFEAELSKRSARIREIYESAESKETPS